MNALSTLVLVGAVLLGASARADEGALSLDVSGGMSALSVRAPYTQPRGTGTAPVGPSPSLLSWSGSVRLGARFALRHELEFAGAGFFEPPVTVFHRRVDVYTPGQTAPIAGTLKHRAMRYGALAGVRIVRGMVWRLTAGLDVGWSHRVYSEFQHLDDVTAQGYDLVLPSFSTDNVVLAPMVGIEWAAGDHWSISLQPRLEVLVGPEPTFAVSVPLTFSWSWYWYL